mgnify:CR=1 FL=1
MFYSIKNLSANVAELIEAPWEGSVPVPDSVTTPGEHDKWKVNLATNYRFLSAYEGVSPEVRITADNPAIRMHGLIVDYDFKSCTTDVLRGLAETPEAEFVPNYGAISFNKGAKLYWLFERPIPIGSKKMHDLFIKKLYKELKLNKWLKGIDSGILANPNQYYECGHPWVHLSDSRIPHSTLCHWIWKCMESAELWSDYKTYSIPLDAVADEIAERFPGRWTGPFQVGARGVRFWDASADNPTGAQVRLDGMMAYSGEQAFMSWEAIFGQSFVARFAADRRKKLMEDVVWDEKRFYMRTDTGKWLGWDKADFSQQLRLLGFDSTKPRGRTYSDLDMAEGSVKGAECRVDLVARMVHFPEGVLKWNGRRYLNLGAPVPIQPMPNIGRPLEWGDGPTHFPFIYKFLNSLFCDAAGEDKYGQRPHLFAWLKHFYENGLEFHQTQGLVVMLAGPPDRGKSLFTEAIVGGLMGGCADGSDYLVDGGKWTANIAESPVVYVGDGAATADHKLVTAMTNKLKKLVANAAMRSAQKFHAEGDVPWFGRCILSCNTDSESLSILPNMDISTKDKISLYRTSDQPLKFLERQEMGKVIAAELPWFARYLLDWEIPEHLLAPNPRFWLVPFHHPELFEIAQQQGRAGLLAEYLVGHMRSLMAVDHATRKDQSWRGTAATLHQHMCAANESFAREFRGVQSFSTLLGQIKARGVLKLEKTRVKAGQPEWVIPYDLAGMDDDSMKEDVE